MRETTAPTSPSAVSFARLITTCIGVRLITDSSSQMFSPFLPIFAAGLGVDVVVMGRLVGLRSAMGLLAPLFGSLADRFGYRLVMSTALLAGAVGMLIIGGSVAVWQAALGMVVVGAGLAGFVPTLQAYLGARLPYAQLARGMGMMEYSWALTGIVGLSLMGQLIAAANWRAPFFVLCAGLTLSFFIVRTLPSARGATVPHSGTHPDRRESPRTRLTGFFRIHENARSTYSAIAATGLIFLGAVQLMIVHGVWFADIYGFGARELGYVALLFGCFDLTGSISVSLFTDRIGKRRSVILGASGALVAYLLIPWLNVAMIPAVVSTALARGFFEFSIVANLSLLSGQAPHQRAKVMTLSAALTLICSTFANFTAPALYETIGIGGITTISATCTALALLLLFTRVREQAPSLETAP